MRRLFIGTLAAAAAFPLGAQGTGQITTLSLEEALEIARRSAPAYQQAVNTRNSARLNIRTAYGQFGPSMSSSFGMNWREGRQEVIGGLPFGEVIDTYGSSYSIGLNFGYSARTFLDVSSARARVEQTEASLLSQETTIRFQVTSQYWNAVEALRNADLQDTLVAGQRLQLELARAKELHGSGTMIETKDAEVRLGRQEIAALQARNGAASAKLQLGLAMGVPLPANVTLTTDVPPTQPSSRLEELVATARSRNPTILTDRAGERSSEIQSKLAKFQYLPTFSFGTSFGGSTNMREDATGDARTFPFGPFTTNPKGLQGTFSFTIWNGFGREVGVQQRSIDVANARLQTKQRELQITTDVTTRHADLQIAWQSIELNNRAAANAREGMMLAQERYRAGASDYLTLNTAVDNYQRSENERLRAIYAYHRAVASLEQAVGRPLR